MLMFYLKLFFLSGARNIIETFLDLPNIMRQNLLRILHGITNLERLDFEKFTTKPNAVLIVAIIALLRLSVNGQNPSYSPLQNLTTSKVLPERIMIQKANNNLDLVFFKGKFYHAFRTAPSHFASKKTVLYVVSSNDRKTWKYETEYSYQKDIREPRFTILGDSLLLYFFIGGTKPLKFEPEEIRVSKTSGEGWTKAENIGLDGFVPWRVRNRNDTLFMSSYYGKNLYSKNHQSDLRLFFSTDGIGWYKLTTQSQIDLPHAEEGEFIFASDGCMYATVRLESNGALICKGDNCAPEKWTYKRTKYKYDSALLFEHNNDVYLISRRNMNGEIDKVKHRKNEKKARLSNLIKYSITKKRTALFKLNKEDLSLTHILDFPSTGDNAFPAIAKIDTNNYWLMNYSSDITKREKNWISGQLGKTFIYETVLTFD